MRVRGPSLSLRYPRRDDADTLFELARDPEVTRFFSWGPYREPSEPLEFIEGLEPARERGERIEFAIADPSDRLIGITGLVDFVGRDRRAEVGTWLGREHWGSGANRESKALILAFAFRKLDLIRVTAVVSPDNPRSQAALERIGFVAEGVLRAWHVHRGERRDVTILRLLREDYEAGPLAGAPVEFEGEPPAAFTPSGST